jgi:hypothetical protein
MHKHIYSFAGGTGRQDRTDAFDGQDLVSAPVLDDEIALYFADVVDPAGQGVDEYAILFCVKPCINEGPTWDSIPIDHPLMKAFRPELDDAA